MSDMLTIDTESGIVTEETINELTVYNEYHPLLKEVMPEYTEKLPNENMTMLLKQMRKTLKQYGAFGLSANQCNVRKRVFVLGTDQFTISCINPKVIESDDTIVKESEGCLSYPGMFLKIDRPHSILAEFTDEYGQVKQQRLEGMTARCYLHELDHMNGVRFVEHVGDASVQVAKRKAEKFIKTFVRTKKAIK